MLLMCCQCVVLPVLLPHAIVLDGLPLIVHCGVRPHVVLIHLVSVLVLLLSALPRHRRGNTQPYIYIYICIFSRLSRLSRLIEEVESVRGKGG